MAKKSRRAHQGATGTAQPVRISRPAQPVTSQAAAQPVDFAKEYHYVVEDLKRIAIIALALLVLLVVAALIIR